MKFWTKIFGKKENPKPIIKIPLIMNGIPTDQYVECVEGDLTYKQLLRIYGEIPKSIGVEPLKKP